MLLEGYESLGQSNSSIPGELCQFVILHRSDFNHGLFVIPFYLVLIDVFYSSFRFDFSE